MKKEMEEVEEGKEVREKIYEPRRSVVGDQLPAGNPRPTLRKTRMGHPMEKSVAPTVLAMSVGSVPSPYGLG